MGTLSASHLLTALLGRQAPPVIRSGLVSVGARRPRTMLLAVWGGKGVAWDPLLEESFVILGRTTIPHYGIVYEGR